jgi:hypothetical protein
VITEHLADLRRSVEKKLCADPGWGETEVTRFLSDTASKLGITDEKLFAALLFVALLQDVWFRSVP